MHVYACRPRVKSPRVFFPTFLGATTRRPLFFFTLWGVAGGGLCYVATLELDALGFFLISTSEKLVCGTCRQTWRLEARITASPPLITAFASRCWCGSNELRVVAASNLDGGRLDRHLVAGADMERN